MLSLLQDVTGTVPSSSFPTLIIFNLNYALLFLLLSGLYMIRTKRKALFSVRTQDLKEWGNISHYVMIALAQSLGMTFIQAWLESLTQFIFGDYRMTGLFIIGLIIENAYLENH